MALAPRILPRPKAIDVLLAGPQYMKIERDKSLLGDLSQWQVTCDDRLPFYAEIVEDVAVKVMDIRQIKEEYVIRNLCREAKLMSRLNHPCIAALFQTIQGCDNVYYLVTELVAGGDLCSFVKGQRTGKLEERQTRLYARQFVSALSHMHSLGVVHRDLKMENVMLNGVQTQIKIVDFGLSNVWSPGSMLRTHCGSPEYAAPELFVTGKQYGPEVDLWSLGIILYGMVVGQLPFVSNHGEHVSSQERRKKLVAQINKGLGSQHRRSLATLSSEFRNMMNKLLVADTSKRIKIKELVVHPWITEKGRKLIRTNPIKDLDSHWQAKIISEISALLQEDVKEVLSSIQEDPMGDAGAMYRILVHHHSLKLLSGDGVTRNVPSLDLNTIDFANYRHSPMMLPMTSRSAAKKHADLNRGDNGFIPKVNLSVDPTDELLIKMRPATVQLTRKTTQAYPDYRCIKSPALRRKAYSASITPKSIRTSPDDSRRVFTSPKPKHDSEEQKNPTIIDKSDMNAKKSNDSGFGWRKIACLGKSSSKQNREKPSRIQTAVDRNKPRSKSDHRPNNRPATCNSGPYYNLKNKQANSDMTVITTQSDSRATKKGGMDPKTFLKQRILKSPQYMEKTPQASGDSSSKPNTAGSNSNTKAHRKPVIYDPIARSIAGYVVNNVPDKIQNLASLRK